MTYEQQHCESCTCFEPRIEITPDFEGGVNLALHNGATIPDCDGCGHPLYSRYETRGTYMVDGKTYHDTWRCRP